MPFSAANRIQRRPQPSPRIVMATPSSQMDPIPPDLESQFQTDCNIAESQPDTVMADASTPAPSPFTLDADHQMDDNGDGAEENANGSEGNPPTQIDIFQGIPSLFGGNDENESIPQTPPFSQLNGAGAGAEIKELPSCSSSSPSPQPTAEVHDFPVLPTSQHNQDLLSPYPFIDPVLDPRLGTQMPDSGASSPKEYYGSVEDNESSPSPEPLPPGRKHRYRFRSETPDSESERREYEFRDRDRGVITTHLDWDESGNYDPAEEGKKIRRAVDADKGDNSKKRRSGQAGVDENGDPRPKRPKAFSLSRARLIGASCVYTISLTSKAGRELLEKYQGQDNWPEDEWNILSDKHVAETLRNEEEVDDGDEPGRRKMLRPRRRLVRYNSSSSTEDLPPIPDPLGVESDLRHHPAARGCVKCRQEGKKCSLRDTGSTWPCVDCLQAHGDDDVVQCQLIQPPAKKTTCENCEEGGKDCSYDDPDTDHALACQQCQKVELCCVAAPDMDSLPHRITYTPPPGVKYTPYRPFVTCTACRQAKKPCSLKSKADDPPCRSCAKAAIPCTFEKLVPTNAGKQKATEQTEPVVEAVEGTEQVETLNLADTRRDSGIATTTLAERPRPNGVIRNSTTTRPTTAEGIRSFTSGVPNASASLAATKAKQQTTLRPWLNTRPANRIRHINPTSLAPATPSTTSYIPPDPKTPASYHLLPPAGPDRAPMTDSHNNAGFFREIVTAFPHPITFQTKPPPPPSGAGGGSTAGCSFCADPSFGLLGMSWKKPAVVQWRDRRGFTEIMDGHREASSSVRGAAMCHACVSARVDVLACEGHELESAVPPGGTGREELDKRAADMWVRLGDKRSAEGDFWCSVCPNAAVWRCVAVQEGGGREGCGLGFCQECRGGWEKRGGDLQGLLEGRLATEGGVVECRADAAFLLEEGLLMRNVWSECME